ncbi:MAG: DUF4097 domain-containing protein [Bacteroidetes bacterium]|nr:DUF4097 domain-containing protein [Bacteroidota bacterium]
MNEERLQMLFNEIKNSPVETGVNEVSGWLDAVSTVTQSTGGKLFSTTKKFISITSVLTVMILGAIYIISEDNGNEKRVKTASQAEKSVVKAEKLPQATQMFEEEQAINNPVSLAIKTDSAGPISSNKIEENSISKIESEIIKMPNGLENADTTVVPVLQCEKATSGSWKSMYDSLYIDTIFNGVKKLVLSGRIVNKVMVAGSNRTNLSMHYSYNYKAKGIFVGQSRCEVSFKKTDSVLTIQIEQKSTVNVGVSFTKLTSNMTLEVPNNIAIELATSQGDIELKEMKNNKFRLKTVYGDIKVKSVEGTTVIGTNYGHIFLDSIVGNVESTTNYGHIKGVNITGSELISLTSNYGNIDLQINNPVSESKLELRTGYGKVKVKRSDLESESSKRLIFGSGRTRVAVTTSYGDVIIK